MRLVAWNCCERFDRKYLHLRDLDFDVAVVCECGPFDPGLGEVREVTAVLKLAVDQPGHTKLLRDADWARRRAGATASADGRVPAKSRHDLQPSAGALPALRERPCHN